MTTNHIQSKAASTHWLRSSGRLVTGDLIQAAEDLQALAHAGFALRSLNPFLELNFVGAPLDVERFVALIGTQLPDCSVLQKKESGRVEYYWIGPGIAGLDTLSAERIGVLQAAAHYANLHLRNGRFELTKNLDAVACPFSGSCQRQIDDALPSECMQRPWERFIGLPGGASKCWYAAGVGLFRAVLKDR